MRHVNHLDDLRAEVAAWKRTGQTIAFVPTMGNLHGGHLSLLRRAGELAGRTVVSIFVNPIQFGKGEDYAQYPSTLAADKRKLAACGLDLLFSPDLAQLYPGGTDTDSRINVPALSDILCGQFRQGHFSGVATVIAKLFFNVQADFALFGEKDYQQLLVVKRVVCDLCMPVQIIAMPTVRESDGLAMSSRNVYLTAEQRATAPIIYHVLQKLAGQLQALPAASSAPLTTLEQQGEAALRQAGLTVEYVSIRRSLDLMPPQPNDKRLSILIAAWLGEARLIDNVKVALD